MTWLDKVRKVKPYIAGEQPKIPNIIKLNTNENPYGPTPTIKTILSDMDIDKLRLYPNADGDELRKVLADYYQLNENQIFLGNGSDEVLALSFLTFFNGKDPILFPDITYSFYPVYCQLYQMNYRCIPLDERFLVHKEEYRQNNSGIILPNPNAPTGLLVGLDCIEDILKHNSESIVIIDEAYIDFGGQSAIPLLATYENLIIIQTFSKSRSLAGLRLGMAFGNQEAISKLYAVKNSFNSYPIDYITQQIGIASVLDEAYFKEQTTKVIATREKTKLQLKELGFLVLDSYANFLFVKHPFIEGKKLSDILRKEGIVVRRWDADRIEQFLRISIGTPQEMQTMMEFLKGYISKHK